MHRALFPELNVSASDAVNSAEFSWTGHEMRALGLASLRGRNLDLKERSERETQILGPRGEEKDCLSSYEGLYAQLDL